MPQNDTFFLTFITSRAHGVESGPRTQPPSGRHIELYSHRIAPTHCDDKQTRPIKIPPGEGNEGTVGVGDQSIFFGGEEDIFARKNICEKLTKCPNCTWFLPE